MTVDERLEFLLQSTESLHATVQQLTGNVQALTGNVQALVSAVTLDGENIRRLASIAESHEQRLDDLEGDVK